MLDQLPAELLQEIASYLPCSSILRLCFTSRRLYAVCYNRNVFRRNAINALYQDDYHKMLPLDEMEVESWELESCASEASGEDSDLEEWWPNPEEELCDDDQWDVNAWGPSEEDALLARQKQRLLLWRDSKIFHSLSAGDSARVSLAIEKASQYFNIPTNERPKHYVENWEKGDFVSWLPHLMTLRHPVCLVIEPKKLQLLLWDAEFLQAERDGVAKLNPSTADHVNSAYCILILLLMQTETTAHIINRNDRWEVMRPPFYLSHPHCMCMDEDIYSVLWPDPPYTKDHPAIDFDHIYATLVYLITRIYPNMGMHDRLPLLDYLPLTEILRNHIPFKTSPENLHRQDLTNEELVNYLSGDWTAWHSDAKRWDSWRMYGPLYFSLDAKESLSTTEPSRSTVEIADTMGHDQHGEFTLTNITVLKNIASMTRTYAPGVQPPDNDYGSIAHCAQFTGHVTPFGLVGHVSEDRKFPSIDGFFWFWKKEWCYASD